MWTRPSPPPTPYRKRPPSEEACYHRKPASASRPVGGDVPPDPSEDVNGVGAVVVPAATSPASNVGGGVGSAMSGPVGVAVPATITSDVADGVGNDDVPDIGAFVVPDVSNVIPGLGAGVASSSSSSSSSPRGNVPFNTPTTIASVASLKPSDRVMPSFPPATSLAVPSQSELYSYRTSTIRSVVDAIATVVGDVVVTITGTVAVGGDDVTAPAVGDDVTAPAVGEIVGNSMTTIAVGLDVVSGRTTTGGAVATVGEIVGYITGAGVTETGDRVGNGSTVVGTSVPSTIPIVGSSVVTATVGASVSTIISVGIAVGNPVGVRVVSSGVGLSVGTTVEGRSVGTTVDGGSVVDAYVVGTSVTTTVGGKGEGRRRRRRRIEAIVIVPRGIDVVVNDPGSIYLVHVVVVE